MGTSGRTVAFALLMVVLAAIQPADMVGDEGEYIGVAVRLGRLQRPSLDEAAAAALQAELAEHGVGMLAPRIERLDDRRDFGHFYAYSAVAAPFVLGARALDAHPRLGFLALNVVLLAAAFHVLSRRLHWTAVWLLMGGPIVWWVGRAHTEPFTYALVAIGLVLTVERPGIAMACIGLAAAQNPPIAALLVAVPAALAVTRTPITRKGELAVGTMAGVALALSHPGYYWAVSRSLTAVPNRAAMPTVQEIGAVLWDANVGLLANHPWIPLAVASAVVALAVKAPRALMRPAVLAAAAGGLAMLVAFSQTVNFNSAATPGLSRYALWLLPLAIPVLRAAEDELGPTWRRSLVPLTVVGCAWSLALFHPARPEGHRRPTSLARTLWTRWPAATDPLPEIFSERLSAGEVALVPVATRGCEKVLLTGELRHQGMWPIPCPPARVPASCRLPGRLCYANRDGDGYRFVPLARPASRFEWGGQRTWPAIAEAAARDRLGRLDWTEARRVEVAAASRVRSARGVRAVDGFEDADRLVLAIVSPGTGAAVALRSESRMRGDLVVIGTGPGPTRRTLPVTHDGQAGELWEVLVPDGEIAILFLEAVGA